ncbi:GSCOCG00010516001-RA-CDS, partial [Cotesia congregata]
DALIGTALHWAAKHGDENIVKLIAGTYKDSIKSVNETTNGVSSIEVVKTDVVYVVYMKA